MSQCLEVSPVLPEAEISYYNSLTFYSVLLLYVLLRKAKYCYMHIRPFMTAVLWVLYQCSRDTKHKNRYRRRVQLGLKTITAKLISMSVTLAVEIRDYTGNLCIDFKYHLFFKAVKLHLLILVNHCHSIGLMSYVV